MTNNKAQQSAEKTAEQQQVLRTAKPPSLL